MGEWKDAVARAMGMKGETGGDWRAVSRVEGNNASATAALTDGARPTSIDIQVLAWNRKGWGS